MSWGPLESATCAEFVLPRLSQAGWTDQQIVPEYHVKRGRALRGDRARRDVSGGRADYVLELVPGLPVAVVEAKRANASAGDGIGQAVEYAAALDLPLAYATNGREIILRDLAAGAEEQVDTFMTPVEVWERYRDSKSLSDAAADALQGLFDRSLLDASGNVKVPRYYQRVAIHRALQAVLSGQQRALLLMATGTGKTFTALQLVAKLRSYWARADPTTNHRILYLADRDWLVRQPHGQFSQAFGADAIARVRSGQTSSRDVYFATYQALDRSSAGEDEVQTLFQEYPPDFFDLIIVDECHRGSARETSSWHAILRHFAPATQLGLTATPKRDANVDTYDYFGEPIYTYSLRQGIEDGFLAPYRIRRVVLDVDAQGWRPHPGQRDAQGVVIPEREYRTSDYERTLILQERTSAVARHLGAIFTAHPGHRAIIFCVDSDHADRMRAALINAAPALSQADPEWVVRIVSKEPRAESYLEHFADPEQTSPIVATTSQMLSTGVDIEDLRYVILFRNVGSMVEFKQIIGRGTRLYPEKQKYEFEIIDYVGATSHFADPAFDGPPQRVVRRRLTPDGDEVTYSEDLGDDQGEDNGSWESDPDRGRLAGGENPEEDLFESGGEGPERPHRQRFVVNNTEVRLVGELFYVHDREGAAPRLVEYVDYAGEQVRHLSPTVDDLRDRWQQAPMRQQIEKDLERHGVDLQELVRLTGLPEADTFDVLAHVAFQLTPETRSERARRVRSGATGDLGQYAAPAREVLEALLARYAEHGVDDVADPQVLQLSPLRELGSPSDIARRFGGAAEMHAAVDALQTWLYGA
jgi:type I restriction enzyme R subunit